MSSTNRGYSRHATDYYITPKECIKDFLNDWFLDMQATDDSFIADRPDRVLWLDPCAGGDATHAMSYPSVLSEEFDAQVMTYDIREDSLAENKEDYLLSPILGDYKPNVIITNPPFYLAQEIIIKALQDVAEGGYVVMLLRLNFFGSKARFSFFEDNMPQRVYVHHKRISFTDDKKTDSIEYMHAVWKKGEHNTSSILKII